MVAEERETDRGDARDAQRRDWRSERAVDGQWVVGEWLGQGPIIGAGAARTILSVQRRANSSCELLNEFFLTFE